jgi:hypothetical protein
MADTPELTPSEWFVQLEARKMREIEAMREEVAELRRLVEAALPRARELRPTLALVGPCVA